MRKFGTEEVPCGRMPNCQRCSPVDDDGLMLVQRQGHLRRSAVVPGRSRPRYFEALAVVGPIQDDSMEVDPLWEGSIHP